METLIPRIFKPPRQSYFIFGPKGTGKSTWLKQNYPGALWLDFLLPDVFRAYASHPERLREVLDAAPAARTVIIDEVQKLPEILPVVHLLIEEKKKIQFILTGSSSRKLKRTGADLLAGRVIKKTFHPFMAVELGKKFNLERSLMTGLVPLVVSAEDPAIVLRTYAALYVKEEVQMEGLVRNIGNFSRFLEAASFSHGALLNISSIARECAVERKVVEGYLGILEDLLLAYRIPVFTKRAKRAVISHPKFYFFDAGVFRSLRPAGPLDSPDEIGGAALEGLVAQHLTAWNSYGDEKNKVYFWRSLAGSEIDFIVYGADVFWCIEVKNAKKVFPSDLNALKSFKKDYPESAPCLLYRGKERIMKDGILCIPCEEFLLKLAPGKTTID